ncbi:hypothetical protein F441_12110 [Phytophthora nicotianae CJ01A1]|uniref:Uncharacterized protein n=4 Tax=Phytophthora nicotianae TaxID=4792 RepID=V9EWC1_PHYNI|nr:hypothetical protein F443_12151 [Phytophthora nicotianae P1569]ETK82828.1 hypothetical protein L915_11868 [Phytophthora nicotianae]ETO71422.1 hypothetical protein F444_12251 [Phytophthora nicotianae P1976]ETP12545.1 hypothetical protein F441_12110 [Phytophthora nicotianae CJ01A1]ETL36200.1 hypothetical protein L916_11796 [Phytophthora nicotianae]
MARSKNPDNRARGTKGATKTFKKLSKRLSTGGKLVAPTGNVSLEGVEKAEQAARIQRSENTRKRKAVAQN